MSAPTPCGKAGCGKLDCSEHRDAAKRERQARIDARRGSSARRGYGRPWQNYRRHWLRLHPLCGDREVGSSNEHSLCVQSARITAATDVDHIKPPGSDKGLFWDPTNHQSLCHTCHSAKTASVDGGFGNVPRGVEIFKDDSA